MKKKLTMGVLVLCSFILFAIGNSNQAVVYGSGGCGGSTPDVAFTDYYSDSTVGIDRNADGIDDRDGIVYQAPAFLPPVLDADYFKAMAKEQGHYNPCNIGNGYPSTSFYYDAPVNTMPNITYIEGNLSLTGTMTVYGVYYVNGTVAMGGNVTMEGIVICNGDFTANGGGTASPNLSGGIVQYGGTNTLRGNGNPVEIHINNSYFVPFVNKIPIINVVSWKEAVSAN